ncbi:uncharacterized protein METZ01_LOCUS472102 [marine metagenome]|uniref:Uncharacterized protein n=1 Tax=marine metagenome TaxID=408172 RepID=A0A383BIJ6_9ZZZZ
MATKMPLAVKPAAFHYHPTKPKTLSSSGAVSDIQTSLFMTYH